MLEGTGHSVTPLTLLASIYTLAADDVAKDFNEEVM